VGGYLRVRLPLLHSDAGYFVTPSYVAQPGNFVLALRMALKQRGWKQHPEGGWSGLGTSPFRIMRSRFSSSSGSAMGTAESSAWL